MITANCPNCDTLIEIDAPRYDCKTSCPKCDRFLYVGFDFYCSEDFEEEYDVYDVGLFYNDNYHLDLVESKIIVSLE